MRRTGRPELHIAGGDVLLLANDRRLGVTNGERALSRRSPFVIDLGDADRHRLEGVRS